MIPRPLTSAPSPTPAVVHTPATTPAGPAPILLTFGKESTAGEDPAPKEVSGKLEDLVLPEIMEYRSIRLSVPAQSDVVDACHGLLPWWASSERALKLPILRQVVRLAVGPASQAESERTGSRLALAVTKQRAAMSTRTADALVWQKCCRVRSQSKEMLELAPPDVGEMPLQEAAGVREPVPEAATCAAQLLRNCDRLTHHM